MYFVSLQKLTIRAHDNSVVVAEGAQITHNGEPITVTADHGWASPTTGNESFENDCVCLS